VVKINGETPATVEKLREVIDGKQPGDTIQLELVRRGQHVNVDVGVAEESAPEFYSGFGEAGQAYEEAARSLSDEAYRQQAEVEEMRDHLAELQDELQQAEEALSQARSDSGSDADARAELEARRADVAKVRTELRVQQERLRSSAAGMQLLDLGSGGRALVVPSNSSAFGGNVPDSRLDAVDDRLRSMEERLTHLEELLQKLVESDATKK